jgi:hypothetical protein
MKRGVLAALVYLLPALTMALVFDSIYGAGPVTRHVGVIHAGVAGAIAFAIASLLSLFSLRFGLACAIVACVLSWPFFGPLLYFFPWKELPSALGYANWGPEFIALLTLMGAHIYSAFKLRALLR